MDAEFFQNDFYQALFSSSKWFYSSLFGLMIASVYGLTLCGRKGRMAPRKIDDPSERRKIRDVAQENRPAPGKRSDREVPGYYDKTEGRYHSNKPKESGTGQSKKETDSSQRRREKKHGDNKETSSSRRRRQSNKRGSRENAPEEPSKSKLGGLLVSPSKRERMRSKELDLDRTQESERDGSFRDRHNKNVKTKHASSPRSRHEPVENYLPPSKSKSKRHKTYEDDVTQRSTSERFRRSRIHGVESSVATAREPSERGRPSLDKSSGRRSKRTSVSRTQDDESPKHESSRDKRSKRDSGTSREKKKASQYDELRSLRRSMHREVASKGKTCEVEKTEEGKATESPFGKHGSRTRKDSAAAKKKKRSGDRTKTKTEKTEDRDVSSKSSKSSKSTKVKAKAKSKFTSLLKAPKEETSSKSKKSKKEKSKRH